MGAGFDIPHGEVPKSATSGIFTHREEDFGALLVQKGVLIDRHEFLSGLFYGEFGGFEALAEGLHRAGRAGGIPWRAKGLAQFHDGGIEKAGFILIQKLSGMLPDDLLTGRGINGEGEAEEP